MLAAEIAVIHLASRGAYGVPRVHVERRRQGWAVRRKTVERIMRERGITGITRRRRARTRAGPPRRTGAGGLASADPGRGADLGGER
ncbi:transposase [Kitasatospora sp. NPDC086791]|uniref:transposase n=1 Tax=Kitasatospora sp. NPDC086791 TaxID=3155178 RepID=UPI00341ED7CC